MVYYFSTQGCTLVVSLFCFSVLLDVVPFAAAAFRALRSKKFDMAGREYCSSRNRQGGLRYRGTYLRLVVETN